MTNDERILLRAAILLLVEWRSDAERDTLLGLIREAAPKVGPDLAHLARSGRALLTAEGPVERSEAESRMAREVSRLVRADLVAAVTTASVKAMGQAA